MQIALSCNVWLEAIFHIDTETKRVINFDYDIAHLATRIYSCARFEAMYDLVWLVSYTS